MRRRLTITLIIWEILISLSLSPYWRSNLALWTRVEEVSPHYLRGAVNRGSAFAQLEDFAAATEVWGTVRFEAQQRPVVDQEDALAWAVADQGLIAIRMQTDANDPWIGVVLEEAWRISPASFTHVRASVLRPAP